MEKSQVLEELQSLIADVLGASDLVINEETEASDVDNWDSLAHVNIIMAAEQHFSIRFPLGEIEDMKNVGDMVASILQKLG